MKILTIALFSFKELVRKKDFYVLFLLLAGLLVFLFSESFFGVSDIIRYLKDIGLSAVLFLSIAIALPFSSRQLPAEIESKTIYPLLSKPVSRADVVIGKYAGSLLISFGAFTLFYAVFLLAIIMKGGHIGVLFMQAYLFSLLLLAVLCAFSLLFSIFLTISANITITLFLYILTYWFSAQIKSLLLSEDLNKISGALLNGVYYLIPHFEFYDLRVRLVHGWEALPAWIVSSIALYTVIYIAAILFLAVRIFKKKNL
ncbi:MAG: ABC transporter permease subunit [Candidatus Omnitrophica bacterium]|nr:ABC transporter permease subunit [Candidatus Omnitrophota bacterium]